MTRTWSPLETSAKKAGEAASTDAVGCAAASAGAISISARSRRIIGLRFALISAPVLATDNIRQARRRPACGCRLVTPDPFDSSLADRPGSVGEGIGNP